jgi:phospholipid/cholesterol/gamma-HCH transport system substrate-binding protein
MSPSVRDSLVGLFVLAGMVALGYLSLPVGGLRVGADSGVRLYATFEEIGGLKPRAQVVIGGVKIGTVESVGLAEDYRPRVAMRIEADLQLPDDSSASILTSGVLGDQYVAIAPGGSDTLLADGGEIPYTQSAVVLERMIGKLVQTLGNDGGEK